MKQNIITIFLLVALLTSSLSNASDLTQGETAYNQGDYQRAYQIFNSLAERGDAQAQTNLGFMYNQGLGVPENDKEAVRWWRAAAEQGVVEAQTNLGAMYAHGLGVAQNYVEAVRWWRAAAEQGDAQAQFNLGVMYANGLGVPQNDLEAHMWANISASQGFQDASELRDFLAKEMTPAQIQEAQRLAQEWVNSR